MVILYRYKSALLQKRSYKYREIIRDEKVARVKNTITKLEIIQVASELFLEKGYSVTSPKMIASELQISPGNITYYFPTKEHLLSVIVEMLCDFQWNLFELEVERGIGSVESICLEYMTVAAACEENEIARDFFTAAFQSEMCRDYLRKIHIERAKRIFKEQCQDWTEEQFVMAELLIMGIDYSTITSNHEILPLKTRIEGALNLILSIYNIDEETKKAEIDRVLQMDCRNIGKQVLNEFIDYVKKTNEQTLQMMSQKNRRKML